MGEFIFMSASFLICSIQWAAHTLPMLCCWLVGSLLFTCSLAPPVLNWTLLQSWNTVVVTHLYLTSKGHLVYLVH